MRDGDRRTPVVEVRELRASARGTARWSTTGRGAAARGVAGRGGRGEGRRHASSGRLPALLELVVPVVLLVAALSLSAFVGFRWGDSMTPPPPRDVPPVPLTASTPEPSTHSAVDPAIDPARDPAGGGAGRPGLLTSAPVPVQDEPGPMLRSVVRPDADWRSVLRELDERRADVFARGDPNGLSRVYVPGSPALHEDAADVQRLAAAGLRARGLRLVLSSVRTRGTAPGRVMLDVVDRMPPYDLVDRSGRVVRTVPGRGERSWQVTLVPARDVVGEWRISLIVQGAPLSRRPSRSLTVGHQAMPAGRKP